MLLFQFVTADVYGVFCWSFCDFGKDFEVSDTNGEEPKDVFISKITKVNNASEDTSCLGYWSLAVIFFFSVLAIHTSIFGGAVFL